MKRSFTLFGFLILMSGFCFAQITAAEMPQIGDTIVYKGINKNTFTEMAATTGVNVTWNHSGVVETADIINYYFVDPATTAGADSFPASTVAEAVDGTSGNFYYSQDTTGFYRDGIWDAASIMIHYSNTLKLYPLPFQFGSTLTSETYSGVGNMTGGIDSVYISSPNGGTYTMDVDGIGTLYVPTGRFDSVYRVYYTEDFSVKYDMSGIGTMTIFTISEYGYEYWKAGFVKPLLVFIKTTYTDMGGTNQVTTSVRYNKTAAPDGPPIGLETRLPALMNLYPNPTSGPATMEFSNNNSILQISDASGKLVLEKAVEGMRLDFDMSAYGKGLYMINVISEDGNSAAAKLLVK